MPKKWNKGFWILKIKPTRYTNFSNLFLEENFTCFGHFLCPSLGVFHCTHSLRAGSGRSSVLIRLASYQQTCMTYTIAVCTVKNSWWWTEELFETCRILFQNKFEKLVHRVGFFINIHHDARSLERQTGFRNSFIGGYPPTCFGHIYIKQLRVNCWIFTLAITISSDGMVLTRNCICIRVYTSLKMVTFVAETFWRIPCNETVSKYCRTCLGTDIVFKIQ